MKSKYHVFYCLIPSVFCAILTTISSLPPPPPPYFLLTLFGIGNKIMCYNYTYLFSFSLHYIQHIALALANVFNLQTKILFPQSEQNCPTMIMSPSLLLKHPPKTSQHLKFNLEKHQLWQRHKELISTVDPQNKISLSTKLSFPGLRKCLQPEFFFLLALFRLLSSSLENKLWHVRFSFPLSN